MKSKKNKISFLSFLSSEYLNMIGYIKSYLNEKYYSVSADDIIQDVALNIFKTLDFDEKVENIGAYFYRALKNKINDYRRKKQKEVVFTTFDTDDSTSFLSVMVSKLPDSSEDKINDHVFYQRLNSALDKLSPNQRMVFIATELDGLSFRVLSEQTNIPVGTLLSWKNRGVKKLREIIKYEDFLE